MILTTVQELDRYAALHPAFPETFAALKNLAAKPFGKGRHEVDGDRIFINAASYDTVPAKNASIEHHGRYIDVMWMASGEETIGVCHVSQLQEITMPYDTEKDACLAKLPSVYTELKIREGNVVILFPEDAHAPSMELHGTSAVQKYIAKVAL